MSEHETEAPAAKNYKLSDKLCRELPALPDRNKIYYDSVIAGFGLCVTPAGNKPRKGRSFVLTYWADSGSQRRWTIGKFLDPWSTEAARTEAKSLKRKIARGV